jgi:hypothetical protein
VRTFGRFDSIAQWVAKHGGNAMTISRSLLALSCLAAIAAASNANAQSLPPEGPVSVTYTATQTSPAKPISIGGGKEYVVLNAAMTATNDAGNAILNNMAGRCLLHRTTDTSAKTSETHGFCNYVDNDGDQIFEQCDWMPGAPNNCKLTGGTGKFGGLQGDLVVTFVPPLKSNYDGITQAIGHKKGSYKIVKTN